ncbi:Scr1 family TA system antitoxin-like transcriptional regulator [Streptomyces sp. ISL-96]|uniref:Scr1 family TA system antitoxin-like transcriptional regulator n=1 Tax=Streptomyces sp. ISL-96 TaxID=2819191 RepID=UPI0027E24F92|nr:Scr1 family TA system antitoxin-like transcriptional regulator [Streptomyces sp. ISL-96]
MVIPGLLQTPAYAHAVIGETIPPRTAEQAAIRLRVRLRRKHGSTTRPAPCDCGASWTNQPCTASSAWSAAATPCANNKIALELAPAFLSDQEAADTVLARYADDIGIDAETVLAVRRYALTGDRHALEGTWL